MIVVTIARQALAAADRLIAGLRRSREIAHFAETCRDGEALRRRVGLDA